jgi:hypothetical protein
VPVIRTEDIPRRYNSTGWRGRDGRTGLSWHTRNGDDAARKEPDVAGDEPVTSPDQHKPANMRLLRVGAVVTAFILVLMVMGNHSGRIEDIFLIAMAGGLILMLIVDSVLRRNGLRS